MSESQEQDMIEIKEMTIDQLAGAVVLFLGAIGSLLLVIWQSRCACRCRIGCSDKCYIFDCQREPPPTKEDENNEDQNNNDNGDEEDIIPPNNNNNNQNENP